MLDGIDAARVAELRLATLIYDAGNHDEASFSRVLAEFEDVVGELNEAADLTPDFDGGLAARLFRTAERHRRPTQD